MCQRLLLRLFPFWVGLIFVPQLLQAQVTSQFSGSPQSGCSPLVVSFTDLSTGPVTTWNWNFGNGNTSTLQNPAAVYVTPGTYTVTLTVSDGGTNDVETKVAYVTVFNNPTSNFTATSPVNGCAPHTVSFQDLSTPGDGAINSWLWDFGDGNTSTAQNPSHTYVNPGSFNVTLVVTDVNGCSHTFVIPNYVNVSTPPVASFNAAPLAACNPPLNVNFNNNSSGGAAPLSYQWDFGDGNTSTAQNPTHTYNATGSFTVTLITTDVNGCADTLVISNYVNINPIVASFSGTTNTCEGQAATFTDLSTGGVTNWAWDFGDGGTSNAQNPSHTYATAGTYTVTLAATGGGCGDTLVQPNFIVVDPAPTALFTQDTASSCEVPFTVNFTDQSTGATSWAWDFGDGSTSTAQNPSHTYLTPGNFPVTLTVTSANGCTNTFVFNNISIVEPVANFNGLPPTGCIPLNVTFNDLSTSPSPIVSWQWDFGDGNTSNAQNPSNTYLAIGSYTVTLIITNAQGCTDTLVRTNYINVGDVPFASFTATPLTACVNEPIQFTDLSTNATTWFWQFGDGGTSNAQNPAYAYQDTGCFTVTLTVSNNGCIDDTTIVNYICISPPLALFNLNPAVGCAVPHTVFFTDQSILPDTWFWDFGDGNTSTAQNPIHTYNTTGSFTVTLTVTDTVTGCMDDQTAQVNISIPDAAFTASPVFGCGPLTVNFTDSSTGLALTYLWNFGDGNTSTAQNPSHTYNNPGLYTVTLTVTDANGCTDAFTASNFVQVIGPDVNFGADTLGGCRPLLVNFTDSTIFGAPVVSWAWDFGDGGTSNQQNPSHNYTATGNFTVSLTVTDLDGCVHTFTRTNYILVTEPVALFSLSDTLACAGVTINFTNLSTGVGLSYLWDFGDGNTSTATNPNHTYNLNGSYTISLTVTDVNGCDSTLTDSAGLIVTPIVADFGANPTNASCPPLLVSFTDSSWFDIVTWNWTFGDGATSTLQNPGHVYATAGSFDVSLIVTNDQGCTDTLFVPGLVNIQGPNGNFVFAPDSGCTPLTVDFHATATNTATYTWDFGDGTVGITTADSVLHTYTQTGNFHPIVILDDGLGCTFTVVSPDSIVVDTIPLVDFAVNTNLICGLDTVYFSDLTISTRPITSWFWDFGDGNTSTLQNPSHYYGAPGNYTVTLTVVNSLGCIDSITKPAEVNMVVPPVANFGVPATIGCAPFSVQFSDSSTGSSPISAWDWDFGDGNTSILQNPLHNYPNPGTYLVTLIATDSFGCTDTTSLSLVAAPGPTANFVADDTAGCPPHPVVFTADSGMGIIQWIWDFGNGQNGTGNPVSTIYGSPGVYTISLIVEDTLGCRDTLVQPNKVIIAPPVADFNPNTTSGCPPLAVTFTDASTSTYPIVSWDWDFGDGNTGTGNPTNHTYQNPGIYTVTLIVQDNEGCRDTVVKNNLIEVFTPPSAGFIILDTLNCDPFTVEFADTSTATVAITNWAWNFGDGNTSTLQNPVHAFPVVGNYLISLIVTDANGCQDTATFNLFSPGPPVATFVASDSLGCPPFPVTFTAGTGGAIAQWDWDFGDGNTGTGNPVSHTYTGSGTWTVTLIVTDTLGCRDTLSKPNYIVIDPPTADFNPDVTSGCPPLAVTFTDASTSSYPIVAWSWDFGDGNQGTGNPVTHSYANPGIYTVTLIIQDSLGCQDTVVKANLIEVFTPPSAGFFISDTLNCRPFTIQLTDSSTSPNSLVAWNWDFGDGTTSTNQNPSHAYPVPGPYLITLVVTDNHGCTDSAAFNFVSPVLPTANFTANDSLGCIPFPVLFTADSTNIIAWFWDFGDGSDTTGNPVSHTYTHRGRYGVTLIIFDVYGCSDTLFKPDYIFVDSLEADFSSTNTVGCPPLLTTFFDATYSDTTLTWQWDFGDGGTSVLQNPTHNYTVPGTYTVTLIATNALGCTDTVAKQVVEVYDLIPPDVPPILMATVLDNTSDSISWRAYTEPDFSHYVLYRESFVNSGVWIAIDSFFNWTDTTYTDQPLNTLDLSYCYKLQVVDICGIRSSLANSPKHCTINLEAQGALNSSVLNWSAYVGWSNGVLEYDVYRVQSYSQANTLFLGSVPGNVTTFVDTNIVCYESYCYRVRARENGGFNETAWSDTSCATPIYEPNQLPLEVVNATVENNNSVRVNWKPAPVPNPMILFLEKSLNGTNWNQIGTFPPSVLTYLDTDVSVNERSYYYQLYFIDSCGDVSPYGNHGRSILLEVELVATSPFLHWNPYSEWANDVDFYEIEVFNDLTQQWQYVDQVPGSKTEYHDKITDLDQPIYCYRVRAHELAGNLSFSLSNEACVPVGPTLYAPSAFSPNGDGTNDRFYIYGHFVANFSVQIYDRWGELIYESYDMYEGWDGKFKGKDCQEEVYTYVTRGEGYDGTEIELAGTVTLIR
ncbi:MAG: PKD domain-containing protein [Bacteroidia bacterium]|nr:PKD domain-containing protein [Bacteroidia bacterium]